MSETVIKVENLSKQYRLGVVGTGTLSHDLNRWWHAVRGKEDPYLQIGETNDRSVRGNSDYVWALKDINFEVKKGEVLGIIGKNGAGKSTLLKLLSRVTSPTVGQIKAKGRIASLLEVGTGFHPELTGRENIFLNGAILGMTKAEIKNKLDEIVDFSGTSRYVDTPVKRYSSGMRVRLAFAVAAHLEPEILIVDEVLAVGDAEFQKKAIGKMQDVSKGEGRTVLFVSHNMGAVQQLCTKCILLENGRIDSVGSTEFILNKYMKTGQANKKGFHFNGEPQNKPLWFQKIYLQNNLGEQNYDFLHDEPIYINFVVGSKVDLTTHDFQIFVTILDQNRNRVFSSESGFIREQSLVLKIESNFLVRGIYSLLTFIHKPRVEQIDVAEDVCQFTVVDNGSVLHIHGDYDYGRVFGRAVWAK
jgi:lipopolysaccharide transport system ATP-binding protein